MLLEHNTNLLVYHIPLDYHNEVGNNVQILKLLGSPVSGDFGTWIGMPVGKFTELETPITFNALLELVKEKIKKDPLVLPFGKKKIRKMDVFITGNLKSGVGIMLKKKI